MWTIALGFSAFRRQRMFSLAARFLSESPDDMSDVSVPRQGTKTAIAAAAVIAASVFCGVALHVLLSGHPHEDAYILFLYSENLSETGRISYFAGGAPAEGATDFLWMVLIAALHSIGIPSGLAAVVLNTLGVALAAGIVAEAILRSGISPVFAIVTVPFLALLMPMQSGYGGFSAPLFSALCLLLVRMLWLAPGKALFLVPILSLVLGLFRPDGVIIGVVATLVGLGFVSAERRRRYLQVMLAAGCLGVVYFAWRYMYFGELLPLPLIVKTASTEFLPGLSTIEKWRDAIIFILVAALFTVWNLPQKRRLLLALLPLGCHLAALGFTVQSQNIAFRFEAPQTLAIVMIAVSGLAVDLSARRIRLGILLLLLCLVQLVKDGERGGDQISYLTNDDYINFFPQLIAPNISEDTTVALTEAGRFAYWTSGEMIDLVGLNTAYTAHNGASADFLAEIRPDLIFIHVAKSAKLTCASGPFCEIDFAELVAARLDQRSASSVEIRVDRAPLAVYEYLARSPEDYRLFAVRYFGKYTHLYALRKDGAIRAEDFVGALSASFQSEHRQPYLQSLRRSAR